MEQDIETLGAQDGASVGRRGLLRGAAWSVPAIALVASTPAFAATGDAIAISTVSVAPLATGALVPARYINIATASSATVTITGTATPGVQVYVKVGSYTSPSVTATGGNWSITVPSAVVSGWVDGIYSFTATVVSNNKPSVTSTQTVTKDTVAPSPLTVNSTTATTNPSTVASNTKSGTLRGTRGTATAASNDLGVVPTPQNGFTFAAASYNGSAWSIGWTWTVTGTAAGQTIVLTQTDEAGNASTASFTV